MTTTAAELPKHFLERCAVCGESTKNRCSACFQAGMPLFFCSVEHQKLVWPVHKTICGARARSPLVPPLSGEEAAALLGVSQVMTDLPRITVNLDGNPTADPNVRCQETPEGFFCCFMGMQHVPGYLNEIIPVLCSTAELEAKQFALDLARQLTYNATATKAGDAKSVPFSELSVWHHVTRMELLLRSFARPQRTDLTCGDFYRFRHHAVILVCLLRLKLADPALIPDSWIHRATEHLLSTTNDVVTFSDITDLPKSKQLVHAFCGPISAVVPLRHDSGFFIGIPGTFETTCW